MKALVCTKPRTLEVRDEPEPQPRPDQAVLQVLGTGICGSDMAGFLGHSTRRHPPLILGHEVVGTVLSAPPGDWPFRIGDRVVANPVQACTRCENCRAGKANICSGWILLGMDQEPGAFAERVAVAARNLLPVDPTAPLAQAAMTEPLANGVHLFGLIERHGFGSLAILGGGTQGILLLQLARALGYRRIVVADTNPARLAVARLHGARLAIDPRMQNPADAVLEWTGGRGVDVAIDAVGSGEVRRWAVAMTRKGGEVLLLGLHEGSSEINFAAVVRHEIRLQGSFCYTEADFRTSQRLLAEGEVNIAAHVVEAPLEEGHAVFERLARDPGDTLKVILKP
ncbi:MAG TPA: zinc-binding dehydrogenase [Chthonomonadales bacterium]|nr:zinc-binding dehydrogenase [Chthonomonadales bacterium]